MPLFTTLGLLNKVDNESSAANLPPDVYIPVFTLRWNLNSYICCDCFSVIKICPVLLIVWHCILSKKRKISTVLRGEVLKAQQASFSECVYALFFLENRVSWKRSLSPDRSAASGVSSQQAAADPGTGRQETGGKAGCFRDNFDANPLQIKE